MPGEIFIDSNVLVYAHDADAGAKHETAKRMLTECWRSKPFPWLSVQVLQEVLVTLRRKDVPLIEARNTVECYTHWRVVENNVDLLRAGIAEMQRWHLSFWDSLILAAARSVGATTVWSEDLSDEQDYGGIRVLNPFR